MPGLRPAPIRFDRKEAAVVFFPRTCYAVFRKSCKERSYMAKFTSLIPGTEIADAAADFRGALKVEQ